MNVKIKQVINHSILNEEWIGFHGDSEYVNADGDGLDSNGSIYMKGGIVHVDGPTNNGNGALDYNGEFVITGGELIAVGSSGMAQGASSNSSQTSVLMNLSSSGETVFTPCGSISYCEINNKCTLCMLCR